MKWENAVVPVLYIVVMVVVGYDLGTAAGIATGFLLGMAVTYRDLTRGE